MVTVCEKDQCAGCMACLEVCSKNAINIKDSIKSYNAIIDEKRCINCNACRNVCQVNNNVDVSKPIIWKQGWASDVNIRKKSSSGEQLRLSQEVLWKMEAFSAAVVFHKVNLCLTLRMT